MPAPRRGLPRPLNRFDGPAERCVMASDRDGQETVQASAPHAQSRPGGRWVATRWAHQALDRVSRWGATRRRPSVGEQHLIHYASHALLSPLTACRWQLELLGDEPEERRNVVAAVTGELKRMERILHDLGVLADAADPDFLRPDRIDLELFAHELVAEASMRADRAWTLDRAERLLVGDAYRLGEAVMALVEAAVERTEPGDEVAIGAGVAGGDVRLWVRDTGRGIDPVEEARILERLRRGVEAEPRHDDRGLGLVVAGVIVDAHGGHVELETEAGKGSTTTLVLPARADRWAHLLPGSHSQL